MAGGNIRAGAAYVELFLKNNKLNAGLAASSKTLTAWGAGVTGVGAKVFAAGAALRAPFEAAIFFASEMGSQLVDMRSKTGVSVEALSELGYAAAVSATDLESLQGGLTKMQKKIGEAFNGNAQAVDSLSDLGVSVAALKELSPDKQFELIADKISKISDPAKRTTAAMEIFGKSGANLLPLMEGGAAGIEAMRSKARELGLQIGTEDAEAAEAFGDQIDTLIKQVKSLVFGVGSALIPAAADLAEKISGAVTTAINWVKANKETIAWVAKIAAVVVGAGAAIMALGVAISTVGGIIGAGMAAIAGLGTVIGAAGSAIAFLISPIGLAIAAVVALGGYFLYTSGAIGEAVGFLSGVWDTLKGDALAAFDGIKNALAAGDFKLAAAILWATLRLEFQRGIGFLQQKWADFKAFFQRVWTEAVFGTARIFTQAWAGLQTAWSETVGFLGDAWTIFTGILTRTWHTAIGFIKKSWVKLKAIFGSDIDVDAKVREINAETDAKNSASQSAQDKALVDAEAKRKAKQKGVDAEKNGALAELEKQRERDLAGIGSNQNAATAQLEKEIEDLKAQKDALLKQANQEAADAAQANIDGKESELKKRLGGAGEEVAKQDGKVQGSFSAFAAARFNKGGGTQEKIADATNQTAKNTKAMKDKLDGGLAMATDST